jgi:transposase-like protein
MSRPKGLMAQPKRWEVEDKFGMGIHQIVYTLFQRHDSLSSIADELGVARGTLYSWLGRNELSLLKAQARYHEEADTREVSWSIQSRQI